MFVPASVAIKMAKSIKWILLFISQSMSGLCITFEINTKPSWIYGPQGFQTGIQLFTQQNCLYKTKLMNEILFLLRVTLAWYSLLQFSDRWVEYKQISCIDMYYTWIGLCICASSAALHTFLSLVSKEWFNSNKHIISMQIKIQINSCGCSNSAFYAKKFRLSRKLAIYSQSKSWSWAARL